MKRPKAQRNQSESGMKPWIQAIQKEKGKEKKGKGKREEGKAQ